MRASLLLLLLLLHVVAVVVVRGEFDGQDTGERVGTTVIVLPGEPTPLPPTPAPTDLVIRDDANGWTLRASPSIVLPADFDGATPTPERDALRELYTTLGGRSWLSPRTLQPYANWGVGDPCAPTGGRGTQDWTSATLCRTFERTLDSDNATDFVTHVDRLLLSASRLVGTLPQDSIARFTLMRALRLNDNEISGTVPPSLGEMSALEELQLQRNALSGTLPPRFGRRLSSLRHIEVQQNSFDGGLPDGFSRAHLRELDVCDWRLTEPPASGPPFDVRCYNTDSGAGTQCEAVPPNAFVCAPSPMKRERTSTCYGDVAELPTCIVDGDGDSDDEPTITRATVYFDPTELNALRDFYRSMHGRQWRIRVDDGTGAADGKRPPRHWLRGDNPCHPLWEHQADNVRSPMCVETFNGTHDIGRIDWISLAGVVDHYTPQAAPTLFGRKPAEIVDANSDGIDDLEAATPESQRYYWSFEAPHLVSSIGGLTALRQLELQGNAIDGTLPSELGLLGRGDGGGDDDDDDDDDDVRMLDTLRLDQNSLQGPVPDTLGDLAAGAGGAGGLRRLFLRRNRLDGALPPSLEQLSSTLRVCQLRSNRRAEQNSFTCAPTPLKASGACRSSQQLSSIAQCTPEPTPAPPTPIVAIESVEIKVCRRVEAVFDIALVDDGDAARFYDAPWIGVYRGRVLNHRRFDAPARWQCVRGARTRQCEFDGDRTPTDLSALTATPGANVDEQRWSLCTFPGPIGPWSDAGWANRTEPQMCFDVRCDA